MLTPSSLAVAPHVMEIVVPPYDFNTQSRPIAPLSFGKYTMGSIQTFNTQGKPNDKAGDSND